jgi:uncharacterized protein (TIGR02266 family)
MEEKRQHVRAPLRLKLDYRDSNETNFLYEYSENISEGGIFITTEHPLPIGTLLVLRFRISEGDEPFEIEGEVRWVNPPAQGRKVLNPGMGVRFNDVTDEQKLLLREVVRRIAIMPEEGPG